MAAWRERMGWLLLAVGVGTGCGGALPEEGREGLAEDGSALASCLPDEASTQRVKTILPPDDTIPRYAHTPTSLVDFKGRLYFAANEDRGPGSLWTSDGSEAGTVRLLLLPPVANRYSTPVTDLTATSSHLFFEAVDAAHGSEPWVSDGTAAGTRLLKDLTPGAEDSYLEHWAAVGSRAVFFRTVSASSTTRSELWTSDGTAAGTVRLRDFGTAAQVSYLDLKLGNALLFFVQDASGMALWRTDGTAAGTVRLKRLDAGSVSVREPRVSGNLGFFTLVDDGDTEVWKTDGTAAGTVRLNTYGSARVTQLLGVLGSNLYLTTTSTSTQFMVVNRIPVAGGATTSVVTLPNNYVSQGDAFPRVTEVSSVPGGRKLFFSVTIESDGPAPRDTQLWVTDGTSAGTTLLRRPLSLSDEYGSPVYAVADDLVFFSAYEATGAGIEPWVSNGTPGGTRRLKDIWAANSSYPRDFLRVGGRVYFSAVDDTQAGQLWSTVLRTTCSAAAAE